MVTRRNDERTVAGRHRMMRRADREVTEPQQIDAIIATCKIVSLAYTDAEGITIVPLNFGYVFDAEFTDQQVRAVTVWKVEADYLTAKVREKPQLHTH